MKYSWQRQIILETIQEHKEHLSAQQIYGYARVRCPHISLGTVYRNLNTLADNDMIGRVGMISGAECFDWDPNSHEHFYCRKCHKIINLDLPEGELTKMRASLVCEKSLQRFSRVLEIGSFLRLSRGEQNSGGAERSSILADAFEAVLAAIYLDGGMEKAREFVLRFTVPEMENPKPKAFKDYKTALQEIVQQNPEEKLNYVLVGESGPDHNKHFVVEVHLNSNVIGKGGGRSKKEAEQQAAREALELMGY